MGIRLHYQTRHEIEYGNRADFIWQQEEVYDLLSQYDCTVFADNSEEPSSAYSFYVQRSEIGAMLRHLNRRKRSAVIINDKRHNETWTVGKFIDFFQEALDNSPKEQEYVYFDWF